MVILPTDIVELGAGMRFLLNGVIVGNPEREIVLIFNDTIAVD